MPNHYKSSWKGALLLALAAAGTLVPAIAEAAEGYATANVNMRSGPSTAYPAVTVIPVGTPVEIHGCLADIPWCDVSFYNGRGWVSGSYVQSVYRQSRVYLGPEYYAPLGIPLVTFSVDDYWDRHYRTRSFYRERETYRRVYRDPNYYRRDFGGRPNRYEVRPEPRFDDYQRPREIYERQRDRDRREFDRRDVDRRDRDRREWERGMERERRDVQRFDRDRREDNAGRDRNRDRGDWQRAERRRDGGEDRARPREVYERREGDRGRNNCRPGDNC